MMSGEDGGFFGQAKSQKHFCKVWTPTNKQKTEKNKKIWNPRNLKKSRPQQY